MLVFPPLIVFLFDSQSDLSVYIAFAVFHSFLNHIHSLSVVCLSLFLSELPLDFPCLIFFHLYPQRLKKVTVISVITFYRFYAHL